MSQKIKFFKWLMYSSGLVLLTVLLSLFPITDVAAAPLMQQTTPPVPRVAIHISEYTKAITPSYDAYWHYFVMPESLKEALDAAGIPWTAISDADIASGTLLYPNGSPRYPILFSLASEAIADNEVGPLRDYVDAGGFLFVGASAFTRRPDGSARSDFALAPEMGLQSMGAWYATSNFTKVSDHRLVSHIPDGSLSWRMPLHAEQPPWGVSPSQSVHAAHYAWRVTAHTAEVIANGDSYPRLATKDYGDGRFIYYSQLNPLIGHGGYGPGMYAYLIFLNAIEEAFESFGFPVVKLSPWQYPYDAAFIVRHDFENTPSRINSIESSSQVEASYGALGDYYFCTGVIRLDSEDPQMTPAQKLAAQNSVRRAVVNYGATIGSHNGGLPNPTYNYDPAEYRYWHWGTDQALDADPASLPVSGFTSGYEYAYTSVLTSFLDISSWLTGTDNGRPGCGTTDTCPRTWVSPYFNSTREGSYQIMEELDVVTMGEQKISPFPHWTISYQTDGKRYPHISLPTSDWFVGSGIAQSMEGHTTASMQELVDFYYDIGALINLYSHQSSTGGVARDYLIYGTSKPRVWSTNAVGIYDWWQRRSPVSITPSYSNLGHNVIAKVQVSGAVDPQTAVEFTIPHWESFTLDDVAVFLDGVPAGAGTYRSTSNGVKVQVGTWVYEVEIRYTSLDGWVQSDWNGGAGQDIWADETRYLSATDTDPTTVAGQLRLDIDSEGDPFFADDFVRSPGEPDPLLPWVAEMGTWSVENEVLEAATSTSYVYAYMEEPSWTDYSVMARIQFPSGAYGGGIGGRLDPATGAHYAAWFYPRDNRLRLVKFSTWTAWNSPNGLATVDIPAPGTDWHTLRMDFAGDHIQVYYDGEMVIDVQDSTGPFLSGGITVDAYQGGAYAIRADDVIVSTPLGYVDQGVLRSSAFDGGLGVQWQRLSWLSSTPDDTGIRVRTRTADQAGQLDAASWSAWVNASGGPVPSSDKRWIQYEVELTSALTTTTPLFQEIGITYVPGPGDHIDVLEPHSGASETHISLSAALLEDDGTPITGRSLEFTLAGLPPVTGVTNGSGVAAASLDLLLAPGIYPLTVAFAGDTDFSPVSTPATFTVTSPWSEWVQDTQADFTADTLTHTTALSVPGSVVLERILMGEGEEQGLFVVEGQQPRLDVWEQTDWSGGSGQMEWLDATRYATASSVDDSVAGQLTLVTVSGSTEIFSDDFSDPTEPLGAWTVAMGSWSVATETLRAISPSGYSYIHTTAGATWSDYTVTGQ
ncbi:MAG: hypothetical protein JW981_11115, partial [Anaerolineae bacterium]|nr:hypothetical protein [Anaerolineae bacterium]